MKEGNAMEDRITLDHGSGGSKTAELIEEYIIKEFSNEALLARKDGAVVRNLGKEIVISTDSFVVSPWRFPGGDIGKLSVCGTVNDVLMSGGIPSYLTLSLILEEGFPLADLKQVLQSIKRCAQDAGVQVVCGDTKVVEHGKGDQIYINTCGIGFLKRNLSGQYEEGDLVLLTGSIGRHGAAVYMAREDLPIEGTLTSDCSLLCKEAVAAMEIEGIRILRDPTRGGLATTCIELIEHTSWGMELDETAIPVDEDVQTLCSLLGFDPLYLACEGRMIAIVSAQDAPLLCERLGKDACVIGTITKQHPGTLLLKTRFQSERWLRKLSGQPLPRIC